jgi:DOPA 4,5-dioxygenase
MSSSSNNGASYINEVGSDVEVVEQPSLQQALANTDHENYGYQRRFGTKDNDCPSGFSSPVESWDVHVYYDSSDPESTRTALQLRQQTYDLFPNLTVNRPYRSPIGPHPTAMWSCELHTPAQLAQYLPWLCTRHAGHSALVHPNTGDPYDDHTVNCYWLGPQLDLNAGILPTREQIQKMEKKMRAEAKPAKL